MTYEKVSVTELYTSDGIDRLPDKTGSATMRIFCLKNRDSGVYSLDLNIGFRGALTDMGKDFRCPPPTEYIELLRQEYTYMLAIFKAAGIAGKYSISMSHGRKQDRCDVKDITFIDTGPYNIKTLSRG